MVKSTSCYRFWGDALWIAEFELPWDHGVFYDFLRVFVLFKEFLWEYWCFKTYFILILNRFLANILVKLTTTKKQEFGQVLSSSFYTFAGLEFPSHVMLGQPTNLKCSFTKEPTQKVIHLYNEKILNPY